MLYVTYTYTSNPHAPHLSRLLVLKRISRLDAIALPYISQSLLNTHVAVERRFRIALDASRREEDLDGIFRLVPGAAHVPVPPTASGFRQEMKARMEGEGEPRKRNRKHVPLPATASGFVDEVFAQMQRKNRDAAQKEAADGKPENGEGN
jgi:homogentisate 1,2-dioxygenase